jgi:Flp pilus assembly protein TadD
MSPRALALLLLGGFACLVSQAAVLVKEDAGLEEAAGGEQPEWYMGIPKLSASNAAAAQLVRVDPRGMIERQIEATREIVQRNPTSARAHADLGNLYLQVNRLDEAAQSFWRAARLAPDKLGMVESLAFAMLALGDHAHGKQIYERLTRLRPDNDRLRFNLASAYYNLGEFESAEQEMRLFLKAFPTGEKGLFNMGAIQFALGDTKEAIRLFSECRAAQPRNAFVLCALARAYRKAGQAKVFEALRAEILDLTSEAQMDAIFSQPHIPVFLLR